MDRCRRPKIPSRSEAGVIMIFPPQGDASGASATLSTAARADHMMLPYPSESQ